MATTTVFAGSYYELLPNGSFTQGTTGLTITQSESGDTCAVLGTTITQGTPLDSNGYFYAYANDTGGTVLCNLNFPSFTWKNGGFLNVYQTKVSHVSSVGLTGIVQIGDTNHTIYSQSGVGQYSSQICNFSHTQTTGDLTFHLLAQGGTSYYQSIDYVYYWDYPMVCKNQSGFIKNSTTVSSVTYGDSIRIDTNSTGSNQKVLCEWGSADLQSLSGFSTIPNGSFEEEFGGWTYQATSTNDNIIKTTWASDGSHSLYVPTSQSLLLLPPDYNNFWGDENICLDYNGLIGTNQIWLYSLYPDANFKYSGLLNNATNGTLCGVIPATSRGLKIKIDSSAAGQIYIDNVRKSGQKFVPASANLCPLSSQSFADNPSCSFTVQKANGDYNAWCQLVDVSGAISNVWNVPITVTGASLLTTGIINELEPSAGDELTSSINVDGFAPDANLSVFFTWKSSLDNVTFYSYSSGYATSYSVLWDGNRLYVPTSIPLGVTTSGQYWRFDYNVVDTVNLMNLSGVSNVVPVEIVGQDILKFTAIENVDSNYFSLGSLIVLPDDESEDITYSIENLSSSVQQLGLVVQNADNSGNDYVIYTATESEYEAGHWNYNNTLTWASYTMSYGGISNNMPLQKIWSVSEQLYDYNAWEGGLAALEKKYYKWVYVKPVYHYFTVNNPDWDNAFVPSTSDYNGITMDVFAPSPYSQMSTTFLKKMPLADDGHDVPWPMYFKVTTRTDTALEDFNMQTYSDPFTLYNVLTTQKYPITAQWWSYAYSLQAEGYLNLQTDVNTAAVAYFQNYSFLPTGYFSKTVTVTQSNGSALPVYLSSLCSDPYHGNCSLEYIMEGGSVKVNAEYYDPLGDIDHIEIRAYLDYKNDANLVKMWVLDSNGASDDPISLSYVLDNIVDLTANAPDRYLFFDVRLIDTNAEYFEISSESVILRQYPANPDDFSINLTLLNTQVGKSPQGRISIKTNAPNTLRGVKLYIHDYNHSTNLDANASDFNKVYWKDSDFHCNGLDCSFDYDLVKDFIWPSDGLWLVTVSALLTTQAESTKNNFTAKTITVYVYYKSFETARVFQTFERSDRIYKDIEQKQLVLQLRDSGQPLSMFKDLQVYLTLARCTDINGFGSCTDIDINYRPDSFYYESITGYNYYFWNELFQEDDGGYLNDDGNYRVKAHVKDLSLTHTGTEIYPLLADKCNDYDMNCQSPTISGDLDGNCFYNNLLGSLNHFAFGCQKTSSAKVTLTDNNSEERRLHIDVAHTTTSPTIEVWACANADTDNSYVDSLEQDIDCEIFYKIGESPIDKIQYFFTNGASDFSKGINDKQYIEVTIPYEFVAFNDPVILKQILQKDYSTDSLDTIGEMGMAFFNKYLFNPIANRKDIKTLTDLVSGNLWKTNIGYDYNFDKTFDPNYISGILAVRLRGIKVINIQDYVGTYSDLNRIDAKDFREYMNYRARDLTIEKTEVQVFGAGGELMNTEVESPLVINHKFSEADLRMENIDANSEAAKYETLPTKLDFFVIMDLVYDHETGAIRRYVPITITALFWTGGAGLGGIAGWLIQNWFFILVIIVVLLIGSIIYSKFKTSGGGGSQTFAFISPKGGG